MPAIVWPDVEAEVVTYIRAVLDVRAESYAQGVTVGRQTANPRPARLVTVRDDGGPALGDVRALARIGVRVWGGTYEETTDLANLVVAIVASMPDGNPVVRADVTRPYALADESGQPLRYFTVELVIRGADL